jgi:hypothetical protein
MKSIIFVLLMHVHGGQTSPVGAFESIEQFLAAISRHRGTNRNPRVGRSRIGK